MTNNADILHNQEPDDNSESDPVATKRDRVNASLRERFTAQKKLLSVLFIGLISVIVLALILFPSNSDKGAVVHDDSEKEAHEHSQDGEAEVKLSTEALTAAGIEIFEVKLQLATTPLLVTGTVEANEQQIQQATPLISGRIERVNVQLGDNVKAGAPLAIIASPQIAQLHGKLHEAETKLALAERELQRVLRSENRVAVTSAKAKLDEAEATLRRTRRLVELGAGAGKDLIAAETAHKTAQAEYEFQSNIALNREVQEAKAEVETARVDVAHIRDELRAFGAAVVGRGERDEHTHNTSLVALRAPVPGTVTERLVNAGAGIEAGKPLFTITNLSTVWVIANVPEAQIKHLRVGAPATIRSAALGEFTPSGRVAYIDPILNEETRTARVRVEVNNPNAILKVGMFVEVDFPNAAGVSSSEELLIPATAVQRIGERTIVFIPKDGEPGHFEVRDVELGGEVKGMRRVVSGLSAGERIVTKGSFTLKGQLMRGELEEDHH